MYWIKMNKKSNFFFIPTILLPFILFANEVGAATCTHAGTSSVTVNAGTITVQRDAPLGGSISNVISGAMNVIAKCTSDGDMTFGGIMLQAATPVSAISTGYQGNEIFSTGLQGVGSTLGTYFTLSGGASGAYTRFITSGTKKANAGLSGGSYNFNFTVSDQNQFQLIKTSNTISSGLINIKMADLIAVKDWQGSTQANFASIPVYLVATVNVLACSVSTPNVNIMLPTVNSNSFTGIGGTQGDTPFSIGLQCDTGAKINVTMNFTQDSDTTNQSVSAVTGKGGAGVASGVGIQLLYGNTPLKNNTPTLLKTSSGGQEFPPGAFTARYFQTKSVVQPGDANATATIALSYQ